MQVRNSKYNPGLNESNMQHRDQWSHQLGFIAASTGAAIGLGQIWKFPYMAGIHGGGNFVLLYIGLVFLLAVPSFFGEVIIGKLGKKNCVDSMTELAEKYQCTPMWKYLGYLGLLTLFIVCCFYNIAASWSIFFIIKMILGTTITEHTFDQLIASPLLMLGAYMS
ncbi:MAG: hypothetical protein OXT67_00910, partial [Zetaproteobacteria bacterium]|nr:hypothetical protein [Zetaproteobacteria bacterium]